METVFLSYTYTPHPDFSDFTRDLVTSMRSVFESMGLRVVSGEDLGGQDLSDRVKKLIEDSDVLVALETPWQKLADGQYIASDWVRREFTHAEAKEKPLVALVHKAVKQNAAYKDRERIDLDPALPMSALLKLMRTVALWRKERGRSYQVELAPSELGARLDSDGSDVCEYRTIAQGAPTPFRPASIWHEPGGVFAYLREIPDGAKVQMKLRLDQETWRSPFTSLVGRVSLQREAQP